MREYDVIVVGSGIAGLSFALKVGRAGYRVCIITKKTRAESNTNYAQGGISAVTSNTDDFESHVGDTLRAGDGLCRENVVRAVVEGGPPSVEELARMGVAFSQLGDGRISLGREGGHSKRRILHVKDVTGKAIEEALLHNVAEEKGIEVLEHYFAIDLITRRKLAQGGFAAPGGGDGVAGLYALNVHTGEVETFRAPVVMLGTGGVGQVYLYATNPDIATGDGIAMAYRVGVPIQNMEFIQFHPTALYTTSDERFLISEAVRGEGAVLRNDKGEAFMERYDERKDLAPRDIVARAIDSEMKRSGARHVWLDITHQPESLLRERFPNIHQSCARHGIDIAKDMIPVVPAAHYLCGGISVELNGATAIPGLYACGEVACSGLHGANRLASNSLLEAVVMAKLAAKDVVDYLGAYKPLPANPPDWVTGEVSDVDEGVVLSHNWEELRRAMWDYVGIVRTTKRLQRAKTRILTLKQEIHDYYWNFQVHTRLLELRNLIQVAELIVGCALQRHESRGLHYTLDYPEKHEKAEDSALEIDLVERGNGG